MTNTFGQTTTDTTAGTTDLQYLIRMPKKATKKPPLLILLHGYGSNEADLFSFANQIPDEWLVIAVRGIFPMGPNQYAWYNVKMVDGKISIDFQQEEKSRAQILNFIDFAIEKYKANKDRVVLAGFSQGANMSLCIGLTEPQKISGFGLFSGRFVQEIQPLIAPTTSFKNIKAFLSHGTGDTMLPFYYAKENKVRIENLGIPLTYSEDSNAHNISAKQWTDFLKWLQAL